MNLRLLLTIETNLPTKKKKDVKSQLILAYRYPLQKKPKTRMDELYEDAQLKKERLEDFKALKHMSEAAELKEKPDINKNYKLKKKYVHPSRRKLKRKDDDLEFDDNDTLSLYGEEEEEEEEESGFVSPEEPRRTLKEQQDQVNHMMRWQSDKEYKIASQRLAILNQGETHTYKPQILEKSKELAQRSNSKKPIHERLLEAGKAKNKKLQKIVKNENSRYFKPRINDNSRRINRNKSMKPKKNKITNLEFWDAYENSKNNPKRRDLSMPRQYSKLGREGKLEDLRSGYKDHRNIPGRKKDPIPWYKSPYSKDFEEGVHDVASKKPRVKRKKPKWAKKLQNDESDEGEYEIDELKPLGSSDLDINLPIRQKSRKNKKFRLNKKQVETSTERRKRLFNEKAQARSIGKMNNLKRKKKIRGLVYKDYTPEKSGKKIDNEDLYLIQGVEPLDLNIKDVANRSGSRENRHKKVSDPNKDKGNEYLYENIMLNKNHRKNLESKLLMSNYKPNNKKTNHFAAKWSENYINESIARQSSIDKDKNKEKAFKDCDDYYEHYVEGQ